MKVLVTGGNGYLGGRIVNYLVNKGLHCKAGDRSIFSNNASLERACRCVNIVVHLASANAQECVKDPEAALLVNGLNTLRLLKASESMGVSKFIYFSTAHIYGSPFKGVLSEESLPRPLHPYSITHRVAEDYVLEFDKRGKIAGTIFRLTNAVGSPVRKDANCWMLVANDLCKQAVLNKKMVLRSKSSVERDYVPISSVASSVFFAINNNNLNGGIYNISSGKVVSLQYLTGVISNRSVSVLGFKPKVSFSSVEDEKSKKNERFVIPNEKLKLSGCVIDTDIKYEIDNLLLNCKKWFD